MSAKDDQGRANVTARLACGCRLGFEPGVEGSPVTIVVRQKAAGCPVAIHVAGLPLYDHREALRPANRPLPQVQPDFEEG
ncbi:MAG TPA: hypothetical protein VLA20_04960 [Vicinamibacterales bacterium]|nr:hypothetical protein [Vicinamibacterales bacterium]